MSNLLKSKIFLGVMIVAIVFVGFAVAKTASATDCSLGTVTLKQGMSGTAVTCLQTMLEVTPATGYFGTITKAAVIAFQTANILTADGAVGALTKAALSVAVVPVDTTVYPAGCTSLLGFSLTTGLSCAAVSAFPAGCTSATGYSATTGLSCAAAATTYSAGCTSATGFSTTTGLACTATATTTFPAGCTSATGFSTTTGLSCATVTTYPAGCTSAVGYSSTTGLACTTTTAVVGAGSVDAYTLAATYNNKKVGEGINDVIVAGLEVEAGSGSDLTINAVKLVFNEGTADNNFDDYADEVSIWLGTVEVGRVAATKFTDDNDWTSTISLTNAKILAGATGTLYVKVSGISNLDTNDATETWTVDYTSVRWTDGQGSLIAEDPATAVRTFSFETSAVAANTEFKISKDVASINDAHMIDVDATADTDDVSILSFKVQILGTTPVTLKALPVNLVGVIGGGDIDDIMDGLTLYMDGVSIGSSNMTDDCIEEDIANGDCVTVGLAETYLFDDLNTPMNPGTYHFLVKADFLSVADALTEGDTIYATFGETQTDPIALVQYFDAHDSTGTNLVDADKTGTADNVGQALAVYDNGINVTFVSVANGETVQAILENTTDNATTTIKYDVTAFGADMYVDGTVTEDGDGVYAAGQGNSFYVTRADTGADGAALTNVTASLTATSGATAAANTTWLVSEGTTGHFTLTVNVANTLTDNGANDALLFQTALMSIGWDLTPIAATANNYIYNLTDFKNIPVLLGELDAA